VWLIRRLEVMARVASDWPGSRIAQVIAAGTARKLAGTLERGVDGATVVWFPDRPAFVARFLLDCAAGRAAGRWEYGEFEDDGWAPSPAIRAVLEREPSTALDALARLPEHDIRTVVERLGPADADAALAALAIAMTSNAADPAPFVVAALGRLLQRSALPAEPRAAALALFIEVARQRASTPPTRTDKRAREAARLWAFIRAAPAGEAAKLGTAMASGPGSQVGLGVLGAVPELVAWPEVPRDEAVQVLMRARSGEPERSGQQRESMLATDLGGMFLILPLLEGFAWRSITSGWPDLGGVGPAAVAQFLAVVGALGAHRNSAAVLDPVLRRALGIPFDVAAPAFSAWSREIEPDAVRWSTKAFMGGLFRDGKVSGAVTIAPMEDGVVAVDGARGIWLGAAPAAPASVRELVECIDDALGRAVAVTGSDAWIEACLQPGRAKPDPINERLLFRLGRQARYATLGEPFDLASPVREAFMLASQTLARELASRLPGFSRSTLPYLSDNVLSFEATVDFEPTRHVVRVGDPPLHLLLSLAGLNRSRFHLETTGDREWVLTQEH
jgi:hypothetical protein